MFASLVGLAACQTEASKPQPVESGSCPTERTEFAAATDRGALPADQPGGADVYYANLRKGPAAPVQGPGDGEFRRPQGLPARPRRGNPYRRRRR
jgi:hypothetical protein